MKLRKKDLDFIGAGKRVSDKEALKHRVRSLTILLPFILVLFFLQSYSNYKDKISCQNQQIEKLEYYLNSEAVLSGLEELERLEIERARLRTYRYEAKNAVDDINEISILLGENFHSIARVAGNDVQIVWEDSAPIRYEDGMLYFEAETKTPKGASAYIKKLEQANLFAGVSYSGITQKVREDGNGTFYVFTVSCELNNPEKNEEKP